MHPIQEHMAAIPTGQPEAEALRAAASVLAAGAARKPTNRIPELHDFTSTVLRKMADVLTAWGEEIDALAPPATPDDGRTPEQAAEIERRRADPIGHALGEAAAEYVPLKGTKDMFVPSSAPAGESDGMRQVREYNEKVLAAQKDAKAVIAKATATPAPEVEQPEPITLADGFDSPAPEPETLPEVVYVDDFSGPPILPPALERQFEEAGADPKD